MSLSIMFTGADDGDDGPFQLASASGWKAFAEWAEKLSEDHYSVKTLAGRGDVVNTRKLMLQLRSALERHPPKNEQVLGTARGLLGLIRVGDGNETATVTDD